MLLYEPWQTTCYNSEAAKKTLNITSNHTIINIIMRINPKYLLLIGLLCAGLTTLARADLHDLGQVDLPNNGDATELQGFIDAGGDPDAVLCFKSVESGSTDFGGSITISVNADNTLHVEWDMTGTGHLVCGFSTKDGSGNLVHYYSVENVNGQGVS